VPYGTVAEHGLIFLAFSADPSRYRLMLDRMFGLAPDGLHDALLGLSEPLSVLITSCRRCRPSPHWRGWPSLTTEILCLRHLRTERVVEAN